MILFEKLYFFSGDTAASTTSPLGSDGRLSALPDAVHSLGICIVKFDSANSLVGRPSIFVLLSKEVLWQETHCLKGLCSCWCQSKKSKRKKKNFFHTRILSTQKTKMHRKCKNTKNRKNYASNNKDNFFVRKMQARGVFYDRIAKNRSRNNKQWIQMIGYFGECVNTKWPKIKTPNRKKIAQKI